MDGRPLEIKNGNYYALAEEMRMKDGTVYPEGTIVQARFKVSERHHDGGGHTFRVMGEEKAYIRGIASDVLSLHRFRFLTLDELHDIIGYRGIVPESLHPTLHDEHEYEQEWISGIGYLDKAVHPKEVRSHTDRLMDRHEDYPA